MATIILTVLAKGITVFSFCRAITVSFTTTYIADLLGLALMKFSNESAEGCAEHSP